MKRLLLILFIILLTTGCQIKTVTVIEPQAFSYDPDKYQTVAIGDGGNRLFVESLSDLEERVMEGSHYLIAVCEVAGDSINRIIEPKEEERDVGIIYGINHVLTPVVIKSIMYSGESVSLEEGDEVYLTEPFFYITDETPEYLQIYGDNSIVTNEYEPIEKGKTYVMFLSYEQSDIYDYEGEITLGTLGLRESIYCISDSVVSRELAEDSNSQKVWQEVIQKYGNK